MKRKEEYNLAKHYLNEIVRSNNKELYSRSKEEIVKDLIELQKKDTSFIKEMLLSSDFYNVDVKYVPNMRAVDFLTEDIRIFKLISYLELVEKMKEKRRA